MSPVQTRGATAQICIESAPSRPNRSLASWFYSGSLSGAAAGEAGHSSSCSRSYLRVGTRFDLVGVIVLLRADGGGGETSTEEKSDERENG